MSARTRVFAIVASIIAFGGWTGCARLASVESPRTVAALSAARAAGPEGVWAGQIWETPNDYFQGVRRVTVDISRGGVWTATIGGVECASGVATVRDDIVFLVRRAGAPCVPHSLQYDRGHMWAEFATSFGKRAATAAIDLVRVGERAQEAASAVTPR